MKQDKYQIKIEKLTDGYCVSMQIDDVMHAWNKLSKTKAEAKYATLKKQIQAC